MNRDFIGPYGRPRKFAPVDFKRGYAVLEPAIREAEAAKPNCPPQQETVLPDGSLTEQRKAELAALSSRVCDVALGGVSR